MDDLFKTITTKQELQELLQSLSQIEQHLFAPEANVKELIEREFPYHISQALLGYATKQGIDLQNQKAFHEMVNTFVAQAQHIPYVSLTLSFMPSKPILEHLMQWVQANLSLHHLLDITVDATVIGGSVIHYQGKYQDNSLRKLLDGYFEQPSTPAPSEQSPY